MLKGDEIVVLTADEVADLVEALDRLAGPDGQAKYEKYFSLGIDRLYERMREVAGGRRRLCRAGERPA